jgi:hypothetical protein
MVVLTTPGSGNCGLYVVFHQLISGSNKCRERLESRFDFTGLLTVVNEWWNQSGVAVFELVVRLPAPSSLGLSSLSAK